MQLDDQTILVVEDLLTDFRLIERAIRKAQIVNPLQSVSDGEAAIEYLSGVGPYADRTKYPIPTMILLDLKIPKKDGFEVLAWMRQQPEIQKIPVVVLTSSSRSKDTNVAYELGANSYLVKPVESEKLVEMLRTLGSYWLVINSFPGVQ